jgi:hypothetical protein
VSANEQLSTIVVASTDTNVREHCNCDTCQLFGREITIRDIESGEVTISGLDNAAELILKQDIVDLLNAFDESRLPSSAYFRLRRALEEIESYREDYSRHADRLNKESIEHRKRINEDAMEQAERLKKDYSEQRKLYDIEYAEHKRCLLAERTENNERMEKEYADHWKRLESDALDFKQKIAPAVAKYHATVAKYEELQERIEAEYTNHRRRIRSNEWKIRAFPYALAALGVSVAALVIGIWLQVF